VSGARDLTRRGLNEIAASHRHVGWQTATTWNRRAELADEDEST